MLVRRTDSITFSRKTCACHTVIQMASGHFQKNSFVEHSIKMNAIQMKFRINRTNLYGRNESLGQKNELIKAFQLELVVHCSIRAN